MDDCDRRIVNGLQGGFPLCERPFAEAGAALGLSEGELISRVQALLGYSPEETKEPGAPVLFDNYHPDDQAKVEWANEQYQIADDDADMRQYLRGCLHGFGVARVLETADGANALRHARAADVDLVISDLVMPGLDGLSLAAALKADARTHRLVEIDGDHLTHRDPRNRHGRARLEAADLVEHRVQAQPAGPLVGEAAHLDRQVCDRPETHDDEEADDQIARH